MHNLRRSVEREEGVKRMEFDLNTGRGTVYFEAGKTVPPAALWRAIVKSGFTPVRIVVKGELYEESS